MLTEGAKSCTIYVFYPVSRTSLWLFTCKKLFIHLSIFKNFPLGYVEGGIWRVDIFVSFVEITEERSTGCKNHSSSFKCELLFITHFATKHLEACGKRVETALKSRVMLTCFLNRWYTKKNKSYSDVVLTFLLFSFTQIQSFPIPKRAFSPLANNIFVKSNFYMFCL